MQPESVSGFLRSNLKEKEVKRQLEHAVEAEVTPFKLAAKKIQGTHFPDLDDELFAWVHRCESRKACPTVDIITARETVPVLSETWTCFFQSI